MALLALRSLAVYGGTATVALWLAHRFVLPIRRSVAVALACGPLLFTGGAMLTGAVYAPVDILYNAMPFGAHRQELRVPPARTPVLGDVPYQMIPWLAAARSALRQGRWPLWNPSVLAGTPLLAAQQAAVLSPATGIGLLLPLPQAWTFSMALRLLVGLLSAYLFLKELGCREAASLFGAAGWAFSDFLVFFLGCSLGAAAMPFPLLLLGARRLARDPGGRSTGILISGLLLVVTAGHPETVLHSGAAAGLYFLFELGGVAPGRRLRSVAFAVLAASLALGLCAVLLLPFGEIVSQTREHLIRTHWYAHERRSLPWRETLRRLVPQFVPYAVGVSGHGRMMDGFVVPSAYAGSLLFPFAFTGLLSRARARWFFAGLGLVCLAVCTKTFMANLLAKLPFFDIAINEYLIVLVGFSLCCLAALGADRLQSGEGLRAFVTGSVLSLGGVTWLFLHFRPRMASLEMPPADIRSRFLLQIVPLIAGLGLVAVLSRAGRADFALAATVAVFVAGRVVEAGSVIPVLPAATFYPPLSVLSNVPRGAPYRTVALGLNFIPNVAALYGLEDVRGYDTMTLETFAETFPAWCIPQGIWFNRVDDPTTPFLAFLNVRWVLASKEVAAPSGWPVLAEGDGLRLFENPDALPRAFVPRRIRSEPDVQRRIALLMAIRDFRDQGVVEEAGPPGVWRENGEARVAIAAYAPQAMDLDVVAQQEALVATSLTAWPGWKATVDGRRVEAIGYNHAFLAFRVPEGRHRLALRYVPDGFRYGLSVSVATLVLSIGWLLLGRRAAP